MKKVLFGLIILAHIFWQVSLFSAQPYVILISLDGFRWDYANRGISPTLDYIEENGVRALSFKPAFPSYTFPNHQSIITGMHPQNHGIIANFFQNKYTSQSYSIGNRDEVINPQWYWGEAFWETAKRHNIRTASYFWPGSELYLDYRRPDYFEQYEHTRPYDMRVKGVLDWLKLPWEARPKFITLYFDDTDSRGHKYGTVSEGVNSAIQNVDSYVKMLIDGLQEMGMKDSVNVIVLSDHGMADTDTSRVIDIDKILTGLHYKTQSNGPLIFLEPDSTHFDEIYSRLKANENHYKVYKKNEIPAYYNISKHPYIYSLFIAAETGWLALSGDGSYFFRNVAQHGFDNNDIRMHGIFFAMGPAFKDNYKTGTLSVLDVYPLLCKIFNIYPRTNIDGKLENIEFILK